MAEENAYEKYLQSYIMYGMADPNAFATQYQQEYTSDNQQNGHGNDDGSSKSGNQQRGGYQQQNSYNNNSNNSYNNNRNNNPNAGYNRNKTFEAPTGDTITQRDTIFIQNLPKNVTADELEKHFGSIGLIKIDKKTNNPKIWIYKDKTTGEGKGEATVTYDDEEAASAAINWFDNKEVLGSIVKIQLATRKNNFNTFNKGGHRGGGGGGSYGNRGGGGGGGGGEDRGGRGNYHGGGNQGNYEGGGGGGNRFNDRRNDRNNDRNFDRNNDRNDRNQGRGGGGGGGYHNRSNNNYSRPAPY